MDRDGSIPHLFVVLYNSNCTARVLGFCFVIIELLCIIQLSLSFLPLIDKALSFPLLESRVDLLCSAEPILYLFRHIFLPVCFSTVVSDDTQC
jgi:hypothetical protein